MAQIEGNGRRDGTGIAKRQSKDTKSHDIDKGRGARDVAGIQEGILASTSEICATHDSRRRPAECAGERGRPGFREEGHASRAGSRSRAERRAARGASKYHRMKGTKTSQETQKSKTGKIWEKWH
ncbi:hypothetical protein B0H17DRAFT_1145460 [Mycena rosella]|uniref:Uncharacterized protein n=1 Tax=Mycena rosella TaxID=1033263 RepID=A0AAD7CQQ4_MYCRO|nr:hypothetical protein B0H17DRAFT_1145460 [Mycena rosella]